MLGPSIEGENVLRTGHEILGHEAVLLTAYPLDLDGLGRIIQIGFPLGIKLIGVVLDHPLIGPLAIVAFT